MGDPVTMAMIGAGVGAITNRRNPLQGALMGGALGGIGGSFAGGAMGAGNAAATAAGTTAGGVPAAITGVTEGAKLVPWGAGSMANATMPATIATNTSTGLIPSMTAPVTMADRLSGGVNALKGDISSLGTFAKENPVATQMGLGAAKDIFSQQPAPPLQSGLLRGSQIAPQEQPQFAMARPPINLLG